MTWSTPVRVAKLELSRIAAGPGVYIISTGKPIERVVGTDPDGIIDIGESGRLRQRLREFVACATGARSRGHAAGVRYAKAFAHHISFDALLIRCQAVDSKAAAYALEGELLAEYAAMHAELPPLNHSGRV